MEKNQKSCLCETTEKIVLSCSGACDLGYITDLTARKLRDSGVRKMNCLAVIGTGNKNLIEGFKDSDILVLDGCAVKCGKNILDNAGLTNYQNFVISDLGYIKGQTPVNEDILNTIFEKTASI